MLNLYLTSGGELSTTPLLNSAGSLFAGQNIEFVYPQDPLKVLVSQPISLTLLTNVLGQIQIFPVLLTRDNSGTSPIDNQVWAGTRQDAGTGTVLHWDGLQEFFGSLSNQDIVLKIYATGTDGSSVTLAGGTNNTLTIDIRSGAPQKRSIWLKGHFSLFVASYRHLLWLEGNVRKATKKSIWLEGSYEAQKVKNFFIKGEVAALKSKSVYLSSEVQYPTLSSTKLTDVRMGDYKLITPESEDLGPTRKVSNLSETASSISLLPSPLKSPAPSTLPNTANPLSRAAELLAITSVELIGEPNPVVPGNIIEIISPYLPTGSTFVLDSTNEEWRLPSPYNPGSWYTVLLQSDTDIKYSRLIMVLLRYVPNEAIYTATISGATGERVLQKVMSDTENVIVWAWKDPVPNNNKPYYQPVVSAMNPAGELPGFRGMGAAILTT